MAGNALMVVSAGSKSVITKIIERQCKRSSHQGVVVVRQLLPSSFHPDSWISYVYGHHAHGIDCGACYDPGICCDGISSFAQSCPFPYLSPLPPLQLKLKV